MTTPAVPSAPAASRAPRWPGDDFPAWMSPMLVKELRQGVQSGVFAWTFILLQAAMFILMTLWLLERSAQSGTRDTGFFHGTFWWLFGIAAMLVIPLRASFSMVSERQGQTLDLLRLTRLSSTQIVFGKWLSTMAQVTLLAVAVLPYVVLQYFFGGLDVIADLTLFLLVLLGASVIAALSIATSGQPAASRGLLMVAVGYGVIVMAGAGSVASMGLLGTTVWTTLGLMSAMLTAVFLEYAAAGIAPAAENHAARIRSFALLTGILALLAARFGGPVSNGLLLGFAVVMSLGVGAAELTTDAVPVASVHGAFARFGPLGRLAAMFLAPGWATGLLFLLLTTGVCAAVIASTSVGSAARSLAQLGCAAAAVAFPLPLMLFFPAGRKRWTAFLLVGAVSMAIFALASAWQGPAHASTPSPVGDYLPLPALVRSVASGSFAGSSGNDHSPVPAILVTGLSLCLVVPRFMREIGMLFGRLEAVKARRTQRP